MYHYMQADPHLIRGHYEQLGIDEKLQGGTVR